jgi:hypothetical protein
MSNTGFYGYGKAWRLRDVTSVLRLGFRYKASIYIHISSVIKTFHSSIQINQPTRCINLSTLLPVALIQLNMFRTFSRPLSGAYQLQ